MTYFSAWSLFLTELIYRSSFIISMANVIWQKYHSLVPPTQIFTAKSYYVRSLRSFRQCSFPTDFEPPSSIFRREVILAFRDERLK